MLHRAIHLTILLAAFLLTGCTTDDLRAYRGFYLQNSAVTPSGGKVKATFLGTTSILFDDGATKLMIDGFLTRPAITGLNSVVQTDPAVVDAALARAGVTTLAAIFVAHSHYDHALDCAYVAQRTGAKLYGSPSTLVVGSSLPASQKVAFTPGSPVTIGAFTVTVISSKHSPAIPGMDTSIGSSISTLPNPAHVSDYKEGGSYDLLITRNNRSILVKPSANFVPNALNNYRAEVLFLGTGTLGNQSSSLQNDYYNQTVAKVQPKLVIPIHWDDFRKPITDPLRVLNILDTGPAFNFLIGKLQADHITFGIMQGYKSVMLFDPLTRLTRLTLQAPKR